VFFILPGLTWDNPGINIPSHSFLPTGLKIDHMTGDWSLIWQVMVLPDLQYKVKKQNGRFGEIYKKIMRDSYTLQCV